MVPDSPYSYHILVAGLPGIGRSGIGREVVVRNRASLLRKVVGSFKVVANEAHFPADVTLQQHFSLFIRKLTMNGNGGGAANSGDVTLQFAAFLEACNRHAKNYEARS